MRSIAEAVRQFQQGSCIWCRPAWRDIQSIAGPSPGGLVVTQVAWSCSSGWFGDLDHRAVPRDGCPPSGNQVGGSSPVRSQPACVPMQLDFQTPLGAACVARGNRHLNLFIINCRLQPRRHHMKSLHEYICVSEERAVLRFLFCTHSCGTVKNLIGSFFRLVSVAHLGSSWHRLGGGAIYFFFSHPPPLRIPCRGE